MTALGCRCGPASRAPEASDHQRTCEPTRPGREGSAIGLAVPDSRCQRLWSGSSLRPFRRLILSMNSRARCGAGAGSSGRLNTAKCSTDMGTLSLGSWQQDGPIQRIARNMFPVIEEGLAHCLAMDCRCLNFSYFGHAPAPQGTHHLLPMTPPVRMCAF